MVDFGRFRLIPLNTINFDQFLVDFTQLRSNSKIQQTKNPWDFVSEPILVDHPVILYMWISFPTRESKALRSYHRETHRLNKHPRGLSVSLCCASYSRLNVQEGQTQIPSLYFQLRSSCAWKQRKTFIEGHRSEASAWTGNWRPTQNAELHSSVQPSCGLVAFSVMMPGRVSPPPKQPGSRWPGFLINRSGLPFDDLTWNELWEFAGNFQYMTAGQYVSIHNMANKCGSKMKRECK